MTIAISLKVNDGVVLAADSASTIYGPRGVINVYNNANKIFNLRKGSPIGAVTWGSGSIGQESISTLAKDFRSKIKDTSDDMLIKENDYTIKEVAEKFKKFIFDDIYERTFKNSDNKPPLGFKIVGYSSGSQFAEEYQIDIKEGKCNGPYKIREPMETGMSWSGEIEAINRLYFGFSIGLLIILKEANLDERKIEEIITLCRSKLQIPMVMAPMPIQDAIDLSIFLVETTINYSKFSPGPSTVGGPIEVAAITKHEGFKWVRRKHYYDVNYNSMEEIK